MGSCPPPAGLTVGRVALAGCLLLAAAAAAPGVAAPAAPAEYAVVQDGECWPVTPLGNGSRTVAAFYDYRTPYTEPAAYTYASHGTRDLQENGVSSLFLYRGSGGVSLVVLHDALATSEGGAPGGGTVTFTFDGLPDGEWVVEDDDYPDRDDEWRHGDATSTVVWKWGPDRTDGGAFRGLGGLDGALTIDPGFNEASAAWDTWQHTDESDRVETWRLRTGDGPVTLAMDEPVALHRGSCAAVPPTAALAAPDAVDTGAAVTLDASASTHLDGVGVEYRWDVDGDGRVEQTTTEPVLRHAYETPGEYTARVTVVTAANATDAAAATVRVRDATPPAVTVTAPANATAGRALQFSVNATDAGGVERVAWTFGDGTTATGSPVTHSYGEPGTYEVTLAVTDAAGNTVEESLTVTVAATDAAGGGLPAPGWLLVSGAVGCVAVVGYAGGRWLRGRTP